MSYYGLSYNVAGVASNTLNSTLNPAAGVEIQTGKNKDFHCELDDGKRWSILAKFIAWHDNPKLVGKAFAIGKVGQDIGVNLDGVDVVAFTYMEDESGAQRLFAVNQSTTSDFLLGLANTSGAGDTDNPVVPLNRATNKYRPNLVDITDTFGKYPTGLIVVTPAQVAASPTLELAMRQMGIKSAVLPQTTVVANFRIDNIISGQSYTLWTNGDTTIGWSWIATGGLISGARVTNTSGEDVTITGIFYWDNPARSFTSTFIAPGNAPGGVTSFNFSAEVNKPVTNASLSVTQPGSSQQQREKWLMPLVKKQIADGKVKTVKYMYV